MTAPGSTDTGPRMVAALMQVTPAPITRGVERTPVTVVVQPPTLIVSETVATIAGLSLSVTSAMKLDRPGTSGVPEMTPAEVRPRPVGSAPDASDQS